ncbi:UrcA family protein [Sphingomonas immobilis]|uniref:UrcA family protein n=1 Tax=Sphingomonas immobilis TaxID=3063997 RepID=A0ABT9A3T9_9SPHN|nr:UrcA family protein [Sphingomonas sp. CA1-15]MDO7844509.1 UrcA family protein [Sphingomonas sp. CA1-15]
MRFPFVSAAIGLLAIAGAAPASAHQIQYPRDYSADDIVVYGTPRLPDEVTSASQRVSYADLHLQYPEDRRELRRRVSLSADYVCDALGEDDRASSSLLSTCRDVAIRDALRQVRSIEARYAWEDRRYGDRAYSDRAPSHVWLPSREW